MSTKSYQQFIIERPAYDQLIVKKNSKGDLFMTFLIGWPIIASSIWIFYVSVGAGSVASFLFLIVVLALFFSTTIDALKKKVHTFDKRSDKVLLNSLKILKISQVSYIEVYIFIDSEETPLESYRVCVVSDELNRKYKIDESRDEYDMRVLARELSAFLEVPLQEVRE